MTRFVRSTLAPAAYHGRDKKPPFFEGWYFKVIDATEQHRYAIIPGVFLSRDADRYHAFIQVLNGSTGQATYHTYPTKDFWSADGKFEIDIEKNRFTADRLMVDIEQPELRLHGELNFISTVPWPVTLRSPGIMGWYAWMPFMQCYHGVVSLDHEIRGELTVNGQRLDFTNGRGYIEKDWGKSFPSAWIWMQSNNFEKHGTSITASVAIIPWIRGSFPGFIIGLWHNSVLYRFASYTGARIQQLDITDETVTWVVEDRRHRLEILATRSQGTMLRAPTTAEMGRRIAETLNATIEVTLYSLQKGDKRSIFHGAGRHAGLEVVGDLLRLKDMWVAERRTVRDE